MSQDPVVQKYRAQIADLDRQILAAVNDRIQLVRQLKAYKERQGLSFHDPAQEDQVIANLGQANPGPLSEQGLEALFRLIMAWAKREASGDRNG